MKIKILIAAVISAVAGLTSCKGGDAKLAGELPGTWKGNSTVMTNDRSDHGDGGEMTCTPTLTFVRTGGTNGGTVSLSADYSVSRGVETVTTAIPVRATVNGNVKASGTWTVKDDDEIMINLDTSKTVIAVDTASMSLTYEKLTDAPQDSLNSMKERIAANITDVIKPMITGRVQKMREFDDVKITGNTMTLEAGHNKMTFTKQ